MYRSGISVLFRYFGFVSVILGTVKSTFQSQVKPEYNTDFEILWTQQNLTGSKSVLIGAD